MVAAGVVRIAYSPTYMEMRGNYTGSSTIAPTTLVTTIPYVPNSVYSLHPPPARTLRVAPENMKMQMHMFHLH
ncbi:MAG: hypothetical protein FJX45_06580 [Alphaproteobacteria bacterium]|nr:hypothetical protein [Alphaproteobacteria bacterium]MBM3651883.1 hypothetical protein [Alphaproteobacteria bacterium]